MQTLKTIEEAIKIETAYHKNTKDPQVLGDLARLIQLEKVLSKTGGYHGLSLIGVSGKILKVCDYPLQGLQESDIMEILKLGFFFEKDWKAIIMGI